MHISRFKLGNVVATPGALRALAEAEQEPLHFLQLHASGAWGELDRADREANEHAVAHEGNPDRQERVLSSYRTRSGAKLWVITEHDRSSRRSCYPRSIRVQASSA
ncbi:MAG: hypothetical protein WBD40_22120 [Tepidisphaeraceae bacterium]